MPQKITELQEQLETIIKGKKEITDKILLFSFIIQEKNRIIYVKAKDEKIIHICRKKIHIRYYLQENAP